MEKNQDYLNLLRKINNNPNSSQRKLAGELGFSLGKLNYCINALKLKGLIKIKNFKDKRGYFAETYNKKNYFKIGIKDDFVQDKRMILFKIRG